MIRYIEPMVGRAKTPAPLFGQRLSALRRERGLTQLQLSEELETTEQLITYYERRAKNPTLSFVEKVASYFDVSPGYFTSEEQESPRRKPGPRSKFDVRVDELKKLPPKQQELVLLMIDSFLAQSRKAS
ncbi:MAG: helix-turn-helix transcriptional regulator [Deltaproteobacteria bacterium]|nr:helix-turn-helix transcriptional regulator [Deltaproteobacteria bacterium]